MVEFELSGALYRVGRLNAFQQFHLSRRLAPIVPTLIPIFQALESDAINRALEGDTRDIMNALKPAADLIAQMSDENAEYILSTALSVVHRNDGKAWYSVLANGVARFDDMGLDTMLLLSVRSIKENLGDFIRGLVTKATDGKGQPSSGANSLAEKTG